jgi:membrane protease YdiL (CAAX protease family)
VTESPELATATTSEAREGRWAARLRGFGPLGILSILVIVLSGNVAVAPMVFVPVGALLALEWARQSRTPWRDLGFVRPRSWLATIAGGVAAGAAFKLLMKSVVMPLFGADPVNQAYHFLAGNRALLPAAALAMINAGFSEETVFRGFGFERLGRLLGNRPWAPAVTVIVVSVLFGLAHWPNQGLAGVEQATITGLVIGTIYAITRQLPFVMILHAAFDLTALALIYWNLETGVAHWFFR